MGRGVQESRSYTAQTVGRGWAESATSGKWAGRANWNTAAGGYRVAWRGAWARVAGTGVIPKRGRRQWARAQAWAWPLSRTRAPGQRKCGTGRLRRTGDVECVRGTLAWNGAGASRSRSWGSWDQLQVWQVGRSTVLG